MDFEYINIYTGQVASINSADIASGHIHKLIDAMKDKLNDKQFNGVEEYLNDNESVLKHALIILDVDILTHFKEGDS